jgi:hypothetical protein
MSSVHTNDFHAIVLFFDIVGFTNFPEKEQEELVYGLRDKVRSLFNYECDIFYFDAIEVTPRILFSPTGDGMAIVLRYGSKACEKILKNVFLIYEWSIKAGCELRCGIHSGKILIYKDIHDRNGFCGEGVNNTQRIMDFGDGHILMSEYAKNNEFKSALSQIAGINANDEGIHFDKHGNPWHIYNIYKKENDVVFGKQDHVNKVIRATFKHSTHRKSLEQNDIIQAKKIVVVAFTVFSLSRVLLDYSQTMESKLAWEDISIFLPKKDILEKRGFSKKVIETSIKNFDTSIIIFKEIQNNFKPVGRDFKLRIFELDFEPPTVLIGFDCESHRDKALSDDRIGKIRIRPVLRNRDSKVLPNLEVWHPGDLYLEHSEYYNFLLEIRHIQKNYKIQMI